MKLFQLEEPDGRPADANARGAAIGIDAASACAEVAFSVGGNALVLEDREGFEQVLRVPAGKADPREWQELLERARLRAERALARPVTHAVIALAATPDEYTARTVLAAAERSGLRVLRLGGRGEFPDGATAAPAAAILAEDLAPRSGRDAAPEVS